MSNARAERRRLDRLRAKGARADLTPADLAHLDPAGWKPGDPMLATSPGASDGTPESIQATRKGAHDQLLADLDENGSVRLGGVVFYEWGPQDVGAIIARMSQEDPRYAQFAPWFVDHPEGTFVLAACVAQPPDGTTPGPYLAPLQPGDPCPDCEGSGSAPGETYAGVTEVLGCQDCLGTGRVPVVDEEGFAHAHHLQGCDQGDHSGPCLVPGVNVQ